MTHSTSDRPGSLRSTFFSRTALGILMVVFFLVPFAMRGARVSVQNMRNDVKDWLPAEFQETKDITWFWRHFLGERFVLASWDNCTADDESYKLMMAKLLPEVPPSLVGVDFEAMAEEAAAKVAAASGNGAAGEGAAGEAAAPKSDDPTALKLERGMHNVHLERPYPFIGDRLGLFFTGHDHYNWGGRKEKWVQGLKGLWYFLTPEGELYEWDGAKAPIAAWAGKLWRGFTGAPLEAKRVATFTPEDAAWYYERPRRLDAQLFRSVTTGPTVLEGLTAEGGVLEGNEQEAQRRLQGSLFGKDGKTTAFVLNFTEAGRLDLHRVMGRGMLGRPRGRLYDLAEECGVSMSQLHLGGPTVDNVAIDEEGTITLVRLVSLCVVLGIGLSYACFRSISATLMVFFVGGVSAVASIALVGWTGATLDAVLMSMPSLVYVLGISGAVHLINYYREAVEENGVAGAPEAAIAHGWKPALMCNLTTAFGLFSLFTSEILPIKKFGLYSGVAVMATLTLLFTYLPAALQIWPQKPRTAAQRHRDENPWYEKYLNNFWKRFGDFIIGHHNLVAISCVIVIAVAGWGCTKINTSVNMLKMFDDSAKILHDYAWLEQKIGKLVPMEIVVRVKPELLMAPASERQQAAQADGSTERQREEAYQLTFLDRMDIVERVQRVIDEEFGDAGQGVAGRSLSAVTFAPVLPAAKGDTLSFARRGATNARLESHRAEFLRSEYLRLDRDDESELWRLSLRIGALQNVDYGEFVHELKSAVEPIFQAHHTREQLLKKLTAARGDEPLGKARVLLVGAPLGALKKASGKSAEKASDKESAANELAAAKESDKVAAQADVREINQTRIFPQTLKDLLTVARLQVTWHDPSVEPASEKFIERVGGYDCVVLVGDHASYDVAAIEEHAKQLIDARDHQFVQQKSATARENDRNVSAVYTGVVPIVYKAQRTLLDSLIESTFWSFVTITPLLMFIARSFSAGMVAMLPNVLPVFVIFGAMGWMGIQVDIGSMMTASIALGVAVDDTIHYLTWFRAELDKSGSRHAAILEA